MSKQKAEFVIKDLIVQVKCPSCRAAQYSPNWSESLGWDKADVKKVGERGQIKCLHCGERFALPAKLFQMMAEI
jgi:transcription elongation factor Elf1